MVEAMAEADMVLVDEAGEVVPLASQEAAEVIASADPWFMAGSTKYCFMPTGGCVVPPSGCESTCTVSPTNTPIQDAINAAKTHSDFDGTINVGPGIYVENVIIDIENLFLIGSPSSIIGADGTVILRGDNNPLTNDVGFNVQASGVTINGFVIEKFGTGIQLNASGQTTFEATYNTIQDNGTGVDNVNSVPGVELHFNVFKNNTIAVNNILPSDEPGDGGQFIHAENNYWGCTLGPVVKMLDKNGVAIVLQLVD